MTWLVLLIIAYLLGLFTDELLGPRPRIELERWRRTLARHLHDRSMPATVRLTAELAEPVSEPAARDRIRAALAVAEVFAYEWSGDSVLASLSQAHTALGVELQQIRADDPAETGMMRVGGFRLLIECSLTYQHLDETLADLNAFVERITTALARQGIVADLPSRTLSIEVSPTLALGVSTLPELRRVLTILRASCLTTAVKGGRARVAISEDRLVIEGELDSTARFIVRDAVLFGSGVPQPQPAPPVPTGTREATHT
jgi:hypothetical protein